MEETKAKKQLSTRALVAIVFGATVLGLGLIVLFVFILPGSGGPARTQLGNELYGTIEAVDDLTAELDKTSDCEIDPQTLRAKYQEINTRVFAVITETLSESLSGAPSADLIADINQYSPPLQTKAQQLEEQINQLTARCGNN